MPRSFSLPAKGLGVAWNDPRLVMRLVIGVLLAANVWAAVEAFRPFGGSLEDLERQRASLEGQLTALDARVAVSKKQVEKTQFARQEGDQFIDRYFVDARTSASDVTEALYQVATAAGVQILPTSFDLQSLEGSDSLQMLTVTAGYEGTYQNLTRLINLIDRSQRLFIIESMQTAAPQNGQKLSIQLKIDAFIRGAAEGVL
jgi:type IV pilus assembly protein PilO